MAPTSAAVICSLLAAFFKIARAGARAALQAAEKVVTYPDPVVVVTGAVVGGAAVVDVGAGAGV